MESALCTLLSALVVLLCSSPECKGEDTVSQPAGDVSATQGETVKRTRRSRIHDEEIYISSKWLETDKSPEFKKDRFEAEGEGNHFHLIIQDVDVTDSAVYYCALRPTVTGNTKTLNKNLWSKDNTILQ
ncbi:hypothetical protein WMY93_032994 [Mugilogobius chulae]|uniref:Immunoglobulin V-set domain-containing protein n=1 Tax=Mugilogobius chulae TaxID=88201 RepID=A0AAW0MU34_9GOBI